VSVCQWSSSEHFDPAISAQCICVACCGVAFPRFVAGAQHRCTFVRPSGGIVHILSLLRLVHVHFAMHHASRALAPASSIHMVMLSCLHAMGRSLVLLLLQVLPKQQHLCCLSAKGFTNIAGLLAVRHCNIMSCMSTLCCRLPLHDASIWGWIYAEHHSA
jgi:hypothetical protein